MNDGQNLPEALVLFLRGYRARSQKLYSYHVADQVQAELERALRVLRVEVDLVLHGQVLIRMLYHGTSLRADEIAMIGRLGVLEVSDQEVSIELPLPDPVPRQIWLDQETVPVMGAYLDRLSPGQDRLFVDEQGMRYSRSQIYQIVTYFRDEEEDRQFEHFFPIYHESDYAVLPTALRLNADTHYTGRGVTIAFIDSGFYPHPDLTRPRNRVRKYLNVPDPHLDDFGSSTEDSWHGMQTSVSAAGNGYLSKGLYKGIAPDSDVVLLKVRGRQGIQTRYIIEAIEWCIRNQHDYNIRIINISLSGERPGSYLRSALDQAAEGAVQAGIVVVVAAGNSGGDRGSETIRPPASAPSVITVGGLNDNNRLDVNAYEMYWSSYGPTLDGILKPEIVAPGIWIAAPILPGSYIALEAEWVGRMQRALNAELPSLVLEARAAGVDWPERLAEEPVEAIRLELEQIATRKKLVPPHYQHVDGTSFSAPIVCSVVAQMLEANPKLTPARIKKILTTTADKLFNVPSFRQGHGLVHPRKAVKEAANDLYRTGFKRPNSPSVQGRTATFYYRSRSARSVALAGEFNNWNPTGDALTFTAPDLWSITYIFERSDVYRYKFVINGKQWETDPENLNREPDSYGGSNARVNVIL